MMKNIWKTNLIQMTVYYGQLPLNRTIEIPEMTILVRAVFHKHNKFYPQVS